MRLPSGDRGTQQPLPRIRQMKIIRKRCNKRLLRSLKRTWRDLRAASVRNRNRHSLKTRENLRFFVKSESEPIGDKITNRFEIDITSGEGKGWRGAEFATHHSHHVAPKIVLVVLKLGDNLSGGVQNN